MKTKLKTLVLIGLMVAWIFGGAVSVSALSITCYYCEDCTDKLKSGDYDVVILSRDIIDHEGSCITFNASNVVFDCNWHKIDGDDIAGPDLEYGIGMMHGTGNTIKNCTISDFSNGIYLYDASNNVITNNNNIISNDDGIELVLSNSNFINSNMVNENYNGIVIDNSNGNTISSNEVCQNTNLDFNLVSGTGNSGDENTCDSPDGWKDKDETGCTNACPGTVTCNSCPNCSNKLTGGFDTVMLTTDITNHAGTCIVFGASNVIFDGNGHKIDGDASGTDYGIYMSGKSGNTVKNCVVTDFYYGIYLTGSSGNTIDKNTADSNTQNGIYLSNSPSNYIFNNKASNNGQNGIKLLLSDSNQIYSTEVSNNNVGIRLDLSHSNQISFNDLLNNKSWGLYLYSSDFNPIHNNDVIGNYHGIKVDKSSLNVFNLNKVCSAQGGDFSLVGGSSHNYGDNNTCEDTFNWDDSGRKGCTFRCYLCTDGVKNGDEEGVDCGGTYCPPCSQCVTGAKYAPNDTVCKHAWPNGEGPEIDINTEDNSCNLIEVCDPNLDYIIEDALLCCEYEDPYDKLSGNRASSKKVACSYARTQAYGNNFRDNFNLVTLKKCLGHYIIDSLGTKAVYMQGYFYGELCCHGSEHCPSICREWEVDPRAWEMGLWYACAAKTSAKPDFKMDGHRCEYTDWGLFNSGNDGYWHSDTDYKSNNDSFADLPAHASINRLSTGTCVDYAIALTTALRKAGYSKKDALSVDGDGHDYNLVKFPGEAKWHYVDTVGNSGGGVHGGSGFLDPKGWGYCTKLDDGCYNDVYDVDTSHCPKNTMIYGCEGVSSSSSSPTDTIPLLMVEVKPAPGFQSSDINVSQAIESCTELNPCVGEYIEEAEEPPPSVDLEVAKYVSSEEILLGAKLEIGIVIKNNEERSVEVIVQETFVPGVAYIDLEPKETWYEGFPVLFYDWSLEIPPQSVNELTFEVVPTSVGYYSFMPTVVSAGGSVYRAFSPTGKVVCNPNGICDRGENYIFCPQDCGTGIQDDFCDMVADGINDPDCQYGVDPDYNPQADTDGDDVIDMYDKCPLTNHGEVVDSEGCSCSQKICDDENPQTIDKCSPETASCYHLSDVDEDEVPDTEDNCLEDYNPDQRDSDKDGIGDQCEIGHIDSNTELEPGTYYISDPDLDGAITIDVSNIVLNCNGAEIIGDGSGYGIYIPETVDNVIIENCKIRNYRYGIYVDESFANKLNNNTLETNLYGILLGFSSKNTVTNNTANSNAQAGVYLEGSEENKIIGNTMSSNDLGIFIHTSPGNEISQNYACNNTNSDFYVYDSPRTGDDNACNKPDGWNDNGTTGCTYPCTLVDIKPGSCPNPLYLGAKGVLPVAVLGTEVFDVTTIDPASIKLEGVSPIRSSLKDVSTPVMDRQDVCDCTTEEADGYTDLTLKFDIQEIVNSIGDVEDGDVLALTLTGRLLEEFDGTPIEGQDCVWILKKGR